MPGSDLVLRSPTGDDDLDALMTAASGLVTRDQRARRGATRMRTYARAFRQCGRSRLRIAAVQPSMSVRSMTVGSLAVRLCGVPFSMCSQNPGPASSCSPSAMNSSRPLTTCTMADREA
jgi:hypothetical protein